MQVYLGAMGQNKGKTAKLNYELMCKKERKNTIWIECREDHSNMMELGWKEMLPSDSVVFLDHFQEFVRGNLDTLFRDEYWKLWFERNLSEHSETEIVVIGDEIGCGVVPLAEDERRYRELYGRMMCELCRRAERVTRIVCGICQVIKE